MNSVQTCIPRVHRRSSRDALESAKRSCPPATVADLIAIVSTKKGISNKMRIYLRCSLNRFADICGASASDLPAVPVMLRTLCREHVDHNPRLNRSRAITIRSALGTALRISGIGEGRRPRGVKLSREYRQLLMKVRSHWDRHPLKRFVRYCSDRNLPAQQIRQATFDAFKEHVHQRTLLSDPKRAVMLARHAWNKAVRTISGWPQVFFEEDGQRQHPKLVLRSSFISELARYRRFMEGTGPSPSGQTKAIPYRASTTKHRCQLVRQFGKILARKTHSPVSLSDLVDPTNAAVILHALRSESGSKLMSIYGRAVFLRHLAKVWCKSSTATLDSLLDLERKYIPLYRGRAGRSFRLVKILFDPERRNQILRLPQALLRAAESSKYDGPRAALKAQIAAALELMLVAPMWPMNLARLRIGRTLISERRKGKTIYRISIPRSEVHNDRPLNTPSRRAVAPSLIAMSRGFADNYARRQYSGSSRGVATNRNRYQRSPARSQSMLSVRQASI